MKLKNLSLANYRGFEQLEIFFEDDVTVLAGVNGVGKSSILDALAVLLSHALPEFTPCQAKKHHFTDDHIYRDRVSLEVFLQAEVGGQTLNAGIQRTRDSENESDRFLFLRQDQLKESEVTANFENLLGQRTLTGDIEAGMRETRMALQDLKDRANPPIAAYFTPKRQLPGQPKTLPEPKPLEPAQAYSRALADREVELREFMHWFHTQETLGAKGGSPRAVILKSLRKVVSELVPEFTNLRIEKEPRLGFVVEKQGKPFYLHQLSDGERGLLALVFDLTRRLAIANPEAENPIAEGVALVMIDEVELHLHPKWQRDIMTRLPEIFKNCQFVVTTHSPQVIGEVEARCVRLLSIEGERVKASTPGMAFGTDSNWILSVLMGAEQMNEEIENEINQVSSLISNHELKDAKEKVEDLRSRVGNTESIQRLASIIERVERLGK